MQDHDHSPLTGGTETHGGDTSLVSQAVILTFTFFVIEAVGGYLAGSLLSFDAGVIATEPEVCPLLSTESDFMREIKSLAVTIIHQCEVRSPKFP